MPQKFKRSVNGRFKATVDPEIRLELGLEYPQVLGVKKYTRNTGDDKMVTTARSGGAKRRVVNMSATDIANIMCPVVRSKVFSYGNNMLLTPSQDGNAFKLVSNAGEQGWYEFVALPVDMTSRPDPCVLSVQDMVLKSNDVMNIALISPNTGIYTTKSQLCYHGGSQLHTFKNLTNASCKIDITEVIPRDRMSFFKADNTYMSVGALLLQDLALNATIANVQKPLNVPVTYDALTDPVVRINAQCRQIHVKYIVQKSTTVNLKPGDEFKYSMDFSGFKFNESGFMAGIGDTLRTTQEVNGLPKMSRIMCVRIIGENGFNGLETGVGPVAIDIAHTMIENHKFRASLYQPQINQTIDYRLGSGLRIVNPDSGTVINDGALDI